jgi:cytochrome c2
MMRTSGISWGQIRRLPLILGLLLLPGAAHAASAARGAIVARVRCSACHFLNRPEKKLGPGLLGIYDRAPSISGVPFKRWDAKALDAWLSGPRKIKINTLMILPPLSPQDRADVIAYFMQQKQRLMAASAASPGAP